MALDIGELFERYQGVVYRRCLSLLRQPDDAAEAVQDVFAAAISGLGRFKLRSAPLTWLYAIATRHCLQKLRNRGTRELKHVLIAEDDALRQIDFSGRADLQTALARLSLDELELTVLAYRDGLTQEEISAVLRVSRKTVGKRLGLLSQKLQMQLEPLVTLASG